MPQEHRQTFTSIRVWQGFVTAALLSIGLWIGLIATARAVMRLF